MKRDTRFGAPEGNPICKERQFGQPNANPHGCGFWKREDTARYKLEQMLKLTEDELLRIANDKDAPLFERRIAKSLIKENEFSITERMMNQVYGLPKQEVQQTNIEMPAPRLAKNRSEKQ